MIFLSTSNGKISGGGMYLTPLAVLNDGLFEIYFYANRIGFKTLVGYMDQAKKEFGTHAYNPQLQIYRGKDIKVVLKNEKKILKNG
jgi:diacylglycerol kinase family enzyme